MKAGIGISILCVLVVTLATETWGMFYFNLNVLPWANATINSTAIMNSTFILWKQNLILLVPYLFLCQNNSLCSKLKKKNSYRKFVIIGNCAYYFSTTGTYYVIISTWAPPQTVDYLLNLSFRGLGVESEELKTSMSVYPNPTSGRFTVSISNAEASDMTLELRTRSTWGWRGEP